MCGGVAEIPACCCRSVAKAGGELIKVGRVRYQCVVFMYSVYQKSSVWGKALYTTV